MITQSDNTATNLAIDKLGLANINAETQALGLRNTWLYKKIQVPSTEPMPAGQKPYGLGKTTARESTMLLARILNCQFVLPLKDNSADMSLCTTMLTMLQKQFYRDGVPRYLTHTNASDGDEAIGNKSGALDAVRNDVGVDQRWHAALRGWRPLCGGTLPAALTKQISPNVVPWAYLFWARRAGIHVTK